MQSPLMNITFPLASRPSRVSALAFDHFGNLVLAVSEHDIKPADVSALDLGSPSKAHIVVYNVESGTIVRKTPVLISDEEREQKCSYITSLVVCHKTNSILVYELVSRLLFCFDAETLQRRVKTTEKFDVGQRPTLTALADGYIAMMSTMDGRTSIDYMRIAQRPEDGSWTIYMDNGFDTFNSANVVISSTTIPSSQPRRYRYMLTRDRTSDTLLFDHAPDTDEVIPVPDHATILQSGRFLYGLVGDEVLAVDTPVLGALKRPTFAASVQPIVRAPDSHFLAWNPTIDDERGWGHQMIQTMAIDQQRRRAAFVTVNKCLSAYRVGCGVLVYDIPKPGPWTPATHRFASSTNKRIVSAMTLIRSLEFRTPLALLPNELLFEIFFWL